MLDAVLLLVGVPLLVMAAMVALAVRQNRATLVFDRALEVLEDPSREAMATRGRWRGRAARVALAVSASGSGETLLRVELAAPCAAIVVTRRTPQARDAPWAFTPRGPSLDIGTSDFKRTFYATGSEPRWLTPEVVDVACHSPGEVVIEAGAVAIEVEAKPTDTATLKALLEAVTRLARAVERAALPLEDQAVDPDGPPVHRAGAILELLTTDRVAATRAARVIRAAPITHPLLDVVTARALAEGPSPDPSARGPALAALGGAVDVARHAIAALGAVGHVDDVGALRARGASDSLRGDAEAAIAAIQARSGGAAGELAIASLGGDLALAHNRPVVER